MRVDRLGEIDFYRPAGTARTGAILFVHGGPAPADLAATPRDWPVYKGYATAAARRGLVAAVVDHSLIRGFDQLVTAADEVEAAVGSCDPIHGSTPIGSPCGSSPAPACWRGSGWTAAPTGCAVSP